MTRPYRFPLDRVLDYRQQLEDQAKLQVARARLAYTEQVERVQAVRRDIEAHEAALSADKEPSADEMWLWRLYRDRLAQDLQEAEQRMLTLAQELSRRQREAVSRAKDRKILDKLKTNQKLRHVQEEQRREQNEFDEIATVRRQPQNH